MANLITKSRFMAGQQCLKRLYLEVHEKDLKSDNTPTQEAVFETGREVGRMAQRHFPGGVLISADDFEEGIAETSRAMKAGMPVIFEACLMAGDLYARIDVLRQNDDGSWDIIEVKSSTKVKPEYVLDVAFQRLVAERSGLTVRRSFAMHINRDCVYPNLEDLFTTVDISNEIDEIDGLEDTIAEYLRIVEGERTEVEVGKHCGHPYDCPFREHCWDGIPKPSIFDLPRISEKAISELRALDVLRVEDIPEDFALTPTQSAYADVVRDGRPRIDGEGIRRSLDHLAYPIHFLDFETDNPAIPRFDGSHPYDQIPFQYSCHVLREDGTVDHHEYLHPDLSDPRGIIANELVNRIDDSGSVVVYSANFERTRLKDLATRFPHLASSLLGIADRLWDLLDVIKYVDHPDFLGSKSLKAVVPVMCPDLTYDGMEVADGSMAQAAWNEYIRLADGARRRELESQLLEYCKLDTWAMVRLQERLLADCGRDHVSDLASR